jgi:hypothetical protein
VHAGNITQVVMKASILTLDSKHIDWGFSIYFLLEVAMLAMHRSVLCAISTQYCSIGIVQFYVPYQLDIVA